MPSKFLWKNQIRNDQVNAQNSIVEIDMQFLQDRNSDQISMFGLSGTNMWFLRPGTAQHREGVNTRGAAPRCAQAQRTSRTPGSTAPTHPTRFLNQKFLKSKENCSTETSNDVCSLKPPERLKKKQERNQTNLILNFVWGN